MVLEDIQNIELWREDKFKAHNFQDRNAAKFEGEKNFKP